MQLIDPTTDPNGYMTFQYPTVKFDGYEFSGWSLGAVVPYLYLAAQARRGDVLAAAALTAGNVTIEAEGGRPYWPMEADYRPEVTPPTLVSAAIDGDNLLMTFDAPVIVTEPAGPSP